MVAILPQHTGHADRPSSLLPVVDDVGRLLDRMVNLYFIGEPGSSDWVLVDAGLPRSARKIIRAAEERFGAGNAPRAIVLTHGHFDHTGSLKELMAEWPRTPIYAHELEMPYLKGKSSYPPPDPHAGGGAFTLLSPLFPKGPIDLGERVFALPSDGSIPGLAGWEWVATPGHSPGHISLFRESDRTLIAGDAIVTTQQESVLSVLTQRQELHGPPRYFTPDFKSAWESVKKLWSLRPAIAATGHGVPMRGVPLFNALKNLAERFDELAVPSHGRYTDRPAITDRQGVVNLPPAVPTSPVLKLAGSMALAFAMGAVISALSKRSAEDADF